MTPVEKRIARRRLEPLSDYQQRLLSFQPLVDALVERIIVTICLNCDVFSLGDAHDVLYQRVLDSDPGYGKAETADERHGRELSVAEDTALMLGIALGRRLGPQPTKGGA